MEPCRRHLPRHKTGPDVPNKGSATANPRIPATPMNPRAQDVLTINQAKMLCRKCFELEYNGKGCVEQFKRFGSWCPGRVILIEKILFLQLLHGFKLFHLVSDFQNSFCF